MSADYHAAGPLRADSPSPEVSILAIVGPGDEPYIAELVADAAAQEGVVGLELVILDRTLEGGLVVEGARVVRCLSPSRGLALRMGADRSRGEFIAWWLPGCRVFPQQLKRALDELHRHPEADLVACASTLKLNNGDPDEVIHGDGLGSVPGPYWESGMVMRAQVMRELERTAFHPVELKLWQRLSNQGRTAHVSTPGFAVRQEEHEALWVRSREDAALLLLADEVHERPQPEITVSICSYNRRDVLVECLDAFSRQLLPYGTYELVVVIDGSQDGTDEMLQGLELSVPFQVIHQENGGLGKARNAGLEVSRGRYVLFADDDSIPVYDCIEHHLKAHAANGVDQKIAVIGKLDQPREALDNALARHLEGSTEPFAYAPFSSQGTMNTAYFYTCNVSVLLSDVRKVGAFDQTFRQHGCGYTDLAMRLGSLGYKAVYEQDALAIHRHRMDFECLKNRQKSAAEAYVAVFSKHPEVLKDWSISELSLGDCTKTSADSAGSLELWEQALGELSGLNLGTLERVGGSLAESTQPISDGIAKLMAGLNRVWWHAGYKAGFEVKGLSGFAELYESYGLPDPLTTDSPRRLLAWPQWGSEESLDILMECVEPVVGGGFSALILRHDSARDMEQSQAFANLEAAFERRFGVGTELDLEVVVENGALDRPHTMRLGRAVDGFLPLGEEPISFLNWIAAERLDGPAEVESWQRRFCAPEEPVAQAANDGGA